MASATPQTDIPPPARTTRGIPSYSNRDYFSSQPFRIIAGSGKCFFIHRSILPTQPGARVFEDSEKQIDLSDWDGNTVQRFIEFLYFGDYQVPNSTFEGDEGAEVQNESEVRWDEVNTPDTVQSLEILEGKDTNILLVHAKLYTLAQYMGVGALQAVALDQLGIALAEINGKISRRAMSGVTELLVYVYSHMDSHIRSYGSFEEPMRDIVSSFAAENFGELVKQREMRLLLSEGGGFVVELMDKVAGRLCDTGKEVGDWKNRATMLDKKVQELEATNTKIRQSEVASTEKIRQLEGKIRQSEAASTEKIRQLEEKIRQSEAENAKKLQTLEAKIRTLNSPLATPPRGLHFISPMIVPHR